MQNALRRYVPPVQRAKTLLEMAAALYRPIAVFPSWDVVGCAIHRSTGITSLEQIRNKKVPLKLSTRQPLQPPFERDSTMYAVTQVLSSLGFSLDELLQWGGQIQSVISPSAKQRLDGIINGNLNAIFDEGIEGGAAWGQTALDHGFQFLPLPDETLERLSAMGYRRAILAPARFAGLGSEIQTVDFSGWPMVVHRDMPEEVAYALCEALELRQMAIPADNDRLLDLAQLCRDDEEAPRDVPLHPGAERFYRERGFL